MGIDYERIASENKINYGTDVARYGRVLLANLYSDRTHFLYELLQNAEDAGAEKIAFHLFSERLEVRHNGKPFNAEDVRAICGLVEGTKADDLTKIGRFGIGFKSVYAYTSAPEIYSGEEVFCIENYVRPRCLSNSGLSSKDETLFVLPFNHDEISAEEAFQKIAGRLKNLGPRTLLFLKNLKEISWKIEDKCEGLYLRETSSFLDVEGVRRVNILWEAGSENGEEAWLLFERPLPGYRENMPNGGTPKVEAAFSLGQQKGTKGKKIVPVDGAGLVVFFPTEKDTCLHFLIQGPYQTTPARDNVPQDNKRNKKLIQETALLVTEALVQIKQMGLLTADFLDVLPQKTDFPEKKGEMFRPILEQVHEALQSKALLPAVDGSHVPAGQALLARTEALRSLLSPQDLADLSGIKGVRWLDGSIRIRDTGDARRRFILVHDDLGISQWDPETLVTRLEQHLARNLTWLKSKSDKWMAQLYALLADQKGLKSKLLTLPVLRLTDNQHVTAKGGDGTYQAYLPPEKNDFPETVGAFPLVKPEVMRLPEHKNEREEDSREEIDKPEKFLKDILGLRPPQSIDIIREYILPQYKKEPPPSLAENLKHFRYIRDQKNKMKDNENRELLAMLKDTRWLLAFSSDDQKEKPFYKIPGEIYLPDAYTGNSKLEAKDRYFKNPDNEEVNYTGRNLLETYFTGYRAWFLVDDYIRLENPERTVQFLKELGVEDKPRRIKLFNEDSPAWEKREDIRYWGGSTRGEELTDYLLEGLDDFLDEMQKCDSNTSLKKSAVLWQLLLKHIRDLREWERNYFFQGIYRWFYRTERSRKFDACFFKSLLDWAWLPDCTGKLHQPNKLFASDEENKKVLGEAVPYLHPFFSFETEEAKWLARKLGIHLQARPEEVAHYLIQLVKNNPDHERIEPIYWFFDDALRRSEKGIREALVLLDNQAVWRGEFRGDWKYFAKDRLLLDDHEQRAELFSQNGVPVWSKDYADRFRDLTKWMGLRTCYSILPEPKPEGDVTVDEQWTEKINNVLRWIRIFLQSFNSLRADFPNSITVKWCDRVNAHYRVNGTEIIESSGQTSGLIGNELFLPQHIDDEEIPDLIGEALQQAFDPAERARERIREFAKDLLGPNSGPIERVLERWQTRGLRTKPAYGRDGQDTSEMGEKEVAVTNESLENGGSDHPGAGKEINYGGELAKRFNHRAVNPSPYNDHVPPGPVADPERRRIVIEGEITQARQREPLSEQRFKRVPVRVWEAKNYEVRTFLKEQYGGKCQICNSTFYKRNGEPYFEGLYLVPHIHARWLDRPGNVLSLCANCCAKFEHGAVEAENIEQQQIINWKCKAEGGMEEPSLQVRLCGEDVKIRFTERHMLDLQELCRKGQ